jgi:hypothetical protein
VQDDEYLDRFFLILEMPSGALARFTIAGSDLRSLVDALRQVQKEIGR